MYVLKVGNQTVGQYARFETACEMAKKRCSRTGDCVTVWGEVEAYEKEFKNSLVYLCVNQYGKIVDCYPWAKQL